MSPLMISKEFKYQKENQTPKALTQDTFEMKLKKILLFRNLFFLKLVSLMRIIIFQFQKAIYRCEL